MIRDNFLSNYDWFRSYCDGLEYKAVENEADGVVYPGINTDIPKFMEIDVLYKLQQLIGPIVKSTMFLRLSIEGFEAPHGAHNDSVMGDYTMIMYMNRSDQCQGGTSLVSHKEHGMADGVEDDSFLKIWERDTNDYEAWNIDEMFHMKQNRAVIFPSNRMHRAEANNFGSSPEDGRLIMGCFFNVC